MENNVGLNFKETKNSILEIVKKRILARKELYDFSRMMNDEFDYANWVKYDLTFRGDNFFLYLHHYYSSKEYTIFYEEKDKMIKADFLFSFVVDEANIPKDLRMFLIFLSENLENLEKLLFGNIDLKNDSQQKLYKKFIKDNFTKSVF